MRVSVLLAAVPLLALTGCATATDSGPAAATRDETLGRAIQEWDAATTSNDAHELTIIARTIPWHVVRDCGPYLDATQREALVTEGENALEALAAAEDDLGTPPASTVVASFETYIANVRQLCL